MPNFISGANDRPQPQQEKIGETIATLDGGSTRPIRAAQPAAQRRQTATQRRSAPDPASTRDRLARLEAFSTA